MLALFVGARDVPEAPIEELRGIPVEILRDPGTLPETSAVPPPSSNQTVAKILPPPKPAAPVDAGAPKPDLDAGRVADAGPEDAGLDAGRDAGLDAGSDAGLDAGRDGGADGGNDAGLDASSDAGAEDAGSPDMALRGDAGRQKADPFSLRGELAKVQRSNTNIKIQLFVAALRRHPAGQVIARLLSDDPQWSQFLGPAGLDPLRDLDTILIYGPQLVDSSQVGVFVKYAARPQVIESAVRQLAKRTGPRAAVSTENGRTVARLRIARAERVFVLYRNRVLAIVPPGGAESAIAAHHLTLPEPDSDREIARFFLKKPSRVRAFKRLGLDVPESIASAQMTILSENRAGAEIQLILKDASTDDASRHARDLENGLAMLTGGMLPLRLTVHGDEIHGDVKLAPIQLSFILKEVVEQIERWRQR